MKVTPLPVPPLPAGRPRMVVTGFMGTGKTESGRRAAALLGLPFLDLDDLVAARAETAVPRIFAAEGEEGFRRREREAIAEAAELSGIVIATGGGAPLAEAYRRLADGSVAAVLTCAPEELAARLGGASDRPLLQPDPGARLPVLLAERAPAYDAAGEPLDTTGRSPGDVAGELAGRYRDRAGDGPARVEVAGPDSVYPVLIGHRSLEELPAELSDRLPGARRAVVVADGGAAHIAGRVAEVLAAAGLEVPPPIGVPPGEAGKTLEVLGSLWESLRDIGAERGDVVVAVGGGATLDVAGFAAATYARGLPLVNVPTTTLAMGDAALGGKTAVDHAGTKNLVGAFHHPALVVADLDTLESLDARSRRAGLGEVVKAAAVGATAAIEVLASAAGDGDAAGNAVIAWGIEQAVRVKAAVVSADPAESGIRAALNLGHTFAHAIESATSHRVPHGEAVAVGLPAAARLGHRLGVTPETTERRLVGVLDALGLPARPADLDEDLDPGALRAAMEGDKKRRGGRHRFVVPLERGVGMIEGDSETAVDALFGAAG